MRYLSPLLLSLGSVLSVGNAIAQQGTDVRLYVQPWRLVGTVLDGKRLPKEVSAVHLDAGEHRMAFWAPGCSIWDTTFQAMDGEPIILRKVLKRSPEFLAYLHERKAVATKKVLWTGLPLLATVGFGIKALKDRNAHDAAFDHLHELRDAYHTQSDPSGIARLKDGAIPAAQDELDRTRKQLTVSLALCGASALLSVYGIVRASKYHRPTFEDKERVRFDGLAWLPGGRGGLLLTGITVPLR